MMMLLFFLFLQQPATRDASGELLTSRPRITVAQFQRLPIPERLKLYNTLYDRPGHPRNVGLAFGFDDKPAETLQHIVRDLPPGDFDRFLRYMTIIGQLSEVRGFDMCGSAAFPVLRSRVHSYRVSSQQRQVLKDFGSRKCPLF